MKNNLSLNTQDVFTLLEFISDKDQMHRFLSKIEPLDFDEIIENLSWSKTLSPLSVLSFLDEQDIAYPTKNQKLTFLSLASKISVDEIIYSSPLYPDTSPFDGVVKRLVQSLIDEKLPSNAKSVYFVINLVSGLAEKTIQHQKNTSISCLTPSFLNSITTLNQINPLIVKRLSKKALKEWHQHLKTTQLSPSLGHTDVLEDIEDQQQKLQAKENLKKDKIKIKSIQRDIAELIKDGERPADFIKKIKKENWLFLPQPYKDGILTKLLCLSPEMSDFTKVYNHFKKIDHDFSKTSLFSKSLFYALNETSKQNISSILSSLTPKHQQELMDMSRMYRFVEYNTGVQSNLIAVLEKEKVPTLFTNFFKAPSFYYYIVFNQENDKIHWKFAEVIKTKTNAQKIYGFCKGLAKDNRLSQSTLGFLEGLCHAHGLVYDLPQPQKHRKILWDLYDLTAINIIKKHNDFISKKSLNQKIKKSLNQAKIIKSKPKNPKRKM